MPYAISLTNADTAVRISSGRSPGTYTVTVACSPAATAPAKPAGNEMPAATVTSPSPATAASRSDAEGKDSNSKPWAKPWRAPSGECTPREIVSSTELGSTQKMAT